MIAQEIGIRHVDLDAHAVGTCFLGPIAYRVAVGHSSLARDGAGAGKHRLQQRGLAGEVWSNQCDAAGAAGGRATILPHKFLLTKSSGPWNAKLARARA